MCEIQLVTVNQKSTHTQAVLEILYIVSSNIAIYLGKDRLFLSK